MADLLDDLEQQAGAFEGAGSAASSYSGILSGVTRSVLQAATGYDSAAGRFRNASGQFQTSGSAIEGVAGGMAVKVGAAGTAVRGELDAVASKIRGLASAAGSGGTAHRTPRHLDRRHRPAPPSHPGDPQCARVLAGARLEVAGLA